MSPPINGMPENFIQSFQYDGQSPQNQMHPQIFMPIPAPPTPSTPRQNGSPSTVTSSNSGANSPTVDRKMMDKSRYRTERKLKEETGVANVVDKTVVDVTVNMGVD
ncbi:8066_t:CDS:2, partial [Entrophospora sp. SA101]